MPREIADAARLLRQVGRLQVRSQRATAACCGGSSAARCHVLGELARSGPLPVTELAGRIGADKGWTSRAVRDLIRDRLLSRQAAPGDARVVKVGLTAHGRRRWSAIDAVLQRKAVFVLAHLTSADLSKVMEGLALLSHTGCWPPSHGASCSGGATPTTSRNASGQRSMPRATRRSRAASEWVGLGP